MSEGQAEPKQETVEALKESLQKSEAMYRSLFENLNSSYSLYEVVYDEEGVPCDYKILAVNPAYEETVGVKAADVVGKTLLEAFPQTEAIWMDTIKKVVLTGEPIRVESFAIELQKYIEMIVYVPQKDRIAFSGLDVTERKLTELDLAAEKQKRNDSSQRAQKLESVGLLAGGIAHDFNNLLGGIFSNVEMAKEASKDEVVSGYLTETMKNLDRARALTQQLLTFAKGGAPIKEVADLFPFVEDTVQFALSGSSVSSTFDIPESLWPCGFDKNQIGQVIDNLIINAQQAMPNGGSIEVSAQNISSSEAGQVVLEAGHYVKLSFKDQGVGIPKEFLAQIFDPYYSTKSKGQGLGLSTCYSIMNRHGGSIDVSSAPGKGSSFHIYLPAELATAPVKTKESAARHVGQGTFLIVDDEKMIRKVLAAMLESFGYKVVSKTNGKDAIDFVTAELKANRPLTGMIFDLTIPGGMGGKDTVVEIRKTCATTPVFVASGYSEDPIMSDPADYGFNSSICKPFRLAELATMLNKHMT
jgi:PAS domain S-box-containing protein